MATSYTSLLGLALPVTGELNGTWGDVANNYITSYLDSSVAGTQTISGSQTAVTLSVTNGSALVQAGSGSTGSAQYRTINCTGNPASMLTITVPASSRQYTVINATSTSQDVKIVGAGPTTGVTISSGEKANVVWNGSDFVKVGNSGGSSTFTDLTVSNNLTLSSGTTNAVVFLNGSKVQTTSSNFTWNGTTLGLTGALTATLDSTFSSTGALGISKGTTAQRPGSPATSMIRYNTTTNEFEGYSGSSPSWKSIGGSALSNDTSTSTNLYPVFAAATTGTAQNLYTGNARLLYKPSTGEFQATTQVASNGIFVNSATIAEDYTVPAGSNAGSFGPITVDSGITVTVTGDSVWTVV